MRTSAYDAPASFAAFERLGGQLDDERLGARGGEQGCSAPEGGGGSRRGPTIVAAAATAPDFRKSRRVVVMAPA